MQWFTAPRRRTTQIWSEYALPAYSYRFNVLPSGVPPLTGSSHFAEMAFVLHNLDGLGYPPRDANPFADMPASYARLARLMTRCWISFVHDLDPNGHGVEEVEEWPVYARGEENLVFEAERGSFVDGDTYRAEAIGYLNEIFESKMGK